MNIKQILVSKMGVIVTFVFIGTFVNRSRYNVKESGTYLINNYLH